MKKKIFNVTIGGYYVVSIVLGIAMALTVCLMALDVWSYAYDRTGVLYNAVWEKYDGDYRNNNTTLKQAFAGPSAQAAWAKVDSQYDFLEMAWLYMPMQRLFDDLYVLRIHGDSYSYLPMLLMASGVVTVFLSVVIMEGKSANKAWRQKMHQAFGWGTLIILLNLAYWYARRRMYGDIPTGVVLVPIVLLAVPLLILKKTRQVKPGAAMPKAERASKVEMVELYQVAGEMADELERKTAGV